MLSSESNTEYWFCLTKMITFYLRKYNWYPYYVLKSYLLQLPVPYTPVLWLFHWCSCSCISKSSIRGDVRFTYPLGHPCDNIHYDIRFELSALVQSYFLQCRTVGKAIVGDFSSCYLQGPNGLLRNLFEKVVSYSGTYKGTGRFDKTYFSHRKYMEWSWNWQKINQTL